MLRYSVCCRTVQSTLHDIQAAVESRSAIATSSYAQRCTFLMALKDELSRNHELISRANRRDCYFFRQQQQQRGMPSVTIPPHLTNANTMSYSHSAGSHHGLARAGAAPFDSPAGVRTSALEGGAGASNHLSHSQGAAPSNPQSLPSDLAHPFPAGAPQHGIEFGVTGGLQGAGKGSSSPSDVHHIGTPSTPACLDSSSEESIGGLGTSVLRSHADGTSSSSLASSTLVPASVSTMAGGTARQEVGGDGDASSGHDLFSTDLHHLVSPLRLDKLHTVIDYLLDQPDPIALPPSCWLRDYVEVKSGEPATDLPYQYGAARDPLRCRGPSAGKAVAPGDEGNSASQARLSHDHCWHPSNRLEVCELAVPLGMIGILSRFRPRISIDAVAMGLFAGNAVLLDGGVSLYHTNVVLVSLVRRALATAHLPLTAVVCVEDYDTAHFSTIEWLQLSEYVDLAVVCGPPKLFQFASRHATIPLLRATAQFSSVYVDQSASFEVALEVMLNSKFQKPGAANAMTTAVIHRNFPRYAELLQALAANGAVLLGDVAAQELAPGCVVELASDEEYRGLSQHGLRDATRTLCVKTVTSLSQALFFIESFGSKQCDSVVASDPVVCATFCREVDTAVALVNASTRLSSGVPLGCGVDFAISTSKVHCRGPLTIDMMTTRKVVARSRSMHNGALR